MTNGARLNRVLLKLSGEVLSGGSSGKSIDPEMLKAISEELAEVHSSGCQIGIVIGGGNIFRGLKGSASGMDRTAADHMGMLATVVNGIALQDGLEKAGVDTRLMSALEIKAVCEPYIRRRAMRHLEKGRVVIFAAGTGNPFFTTDTAAALRAAEIEADALLKGTHSGVDGVYDSDPRHNPDAVKYDEIPYMDVMNKDLKVMDATAIAFCRDHNIPIVVFDMSAHGALRSILTGGQVGTIVR